MKHLRIFIVLLMTLSFLSYGLGGDKLQVALFMDKGAGPWGGEKEYVTALMSTLRYLDSTITVRAVSGSDIRSKGLDRYHVIIFPGGSGGGQARSLGKKGREKVISFVKKGGGFIGICAGAYLGQDYDIDFPGYSLGLSPFEVMNNGRGWARGKAIVEVTLTRTGRDVFHEVAGYRSLFMHYANGPMLVPSGWLPRYGEVLMRMKTDLCFQNRKRCGETPGAAVATLSEYHRGKVLLMSLHPEQTPGMKWMLLRMVTRVAGREDGTISGSFIRPVLYRNEILFDDHWQKKTKELRAVALDEKLKLSLRIQAIWKLQQMGYREFDTLLPELEKDRNRYIRRAAQDSIQWNDLFHLMD